MSPNESGVKMIAKLTNARCEIEDALNLSIPAARYNPAMISEATRKKLSNIVDELDAVLQQLEKSH